MNPRSCLVIGSGHFGSQALEKLLRKNPPSKLKIVDISKKALQRISSHSVETIVDDGIAYLQQALLKGEEIDYIIPAIPFHVAFEFILSQLRPAGARRTEIPPLYGLPNLIVGKTGDLYTSLANFLCPEDCPEPSEYCTVTGKKRKKPLHKILADLDLSYPSKVIRSEQLGPGVGGFRVKELLRIADDIKKDKTPHRLILMSTACRCHGVTSALAF